LVSDDIYDTLREDFLEVIDPTNKLLDSVGEIIDGEDEDSQNDFFQKSKHEIIAGSQSKVKYSENEKFEEKITNFKSKITISDKMDGITIVSTYTNDKEKAFEHLNEVFEYHLDYIEKSNKSSKEKLQIKEYILSQKSELISKIKNVKDENYFPYKIVTRGDGIIGEEITLNAIDMKGVVFEIDKDNLPECQIDKSELIIRSEAVISLSDFNGLRYKNPRNGVATIR
jgi:NAD-dependent DNA ligase